jgi:glycosyltransferase involved in cell wall biosynthesis
MKYVFASKFYYRRGGLESYLFKTATLLESKGHTVIPFSTDHAKNIKSEYSKYFCRYFDLSGESDLGAKEKLTALSNMVFNQEAYSNIKSLIESQKPRILQGFGVTKHLSGSIFKAAKEMGVHTVMRLSDYALICPNSVAIDGNGSICERIECSSPLGARRLLAAKCIDRSLPKSIAGLLENKINRLMGYYKKYVDVFIAPSIFLRDKFIELYVLPKEKIVHVPIFFDCKNSVNKVSEGKYFLYAGLIDVHKGIKTLLKAWKLFPKTKLILAGEGPCVNEYSEYIEKNGINAEFVGFKTYIELKELIDESHALIIPSEWYENSPNIILEAYAAGKPVIASKIGGIPELVKDKETGFLFKMREEADLKEKIDMILNDLSGSREMGLAGRRFVENDFSPEKHYSLLMECYNSI